MGRIFCWLVDSGGSHSTKCRGDRVKYMLVRDDDERPGKERAKPNSGRQRRRTSECATKSALKHSI
jgi:hypothetical protein